MFLLRYSSSRGVSTAPRETSSSGLDWQQICGTLTWKTSESRNLVPNTVMPLVSMEAWSLLGRGLVSFLLQSRTMVTVFFSTLMATRCHLTRERIKESVRTSANVSNNRRQSPCCSRRLQRSHVSLTPPRPQNRFATALKGYCIPGNSGPHSCPPHSGPV